MRSLPGTALIHSEQDMHPRRTRGWGGFQCCLRAAMTQRALQVQRLLPHQGTPRDWREGENDAQEQLSRSPAFPRV